MTKLKKKDEYCHNCRYRDVTDEDIVICKLHKKTVNWEYTCKEWRNQE